ncbi:hypothetical protein FOPG_05118 [Fusarium oxysporum f. sp. conglutinans race 2 54008]|nr:hypothetical protein FOPG_05118 [Fusarium oxysporum f. sp. conglutinans race 2 54008]KAI8407078.1 hypothetical protein FOFC_12512 [Fusarium oxysporum]
MKEGQPDINSSLGPTANSYREERRKGGNSKRSKKMINPEVCNQGSLYCTIRRRVLLIKHILNCDITRLDHYTN